MSRPGDQVREVSGLLSGIQEDGTYVPPTDDEDYVPDIENAGEEEIPADELSEDQEIDLEDEGIDEADVEETEEVDEEAEEVEDVAEEQDVETINQLAQLLEVEEGQLYDIQVPLGDGLAPVSIGQLKDGYMEVERSRTQLQNERAAFESDVEQFKQQASQQNLPMMNEEVMEAAVTMRMIQEQYQNIDWDAFEQQDAAKALLHRQKLNDSYTHAENKYNQLMSMHNQQKEDALKQVKVKSRQKILESIPEWSDPAVFKKEGDAIGNILVKEYGYTPKEISQVYDHRLSKLLRDFMILKQKDAQADTVVKKLRIAPKKLPSSGQGVKKVVQKKKLDKTIAAAKNSRDVRDKVSAVSQLINNS